MANQGGGTGNRRRRYPGHSHGRLALGIGGAVELIVLQLVSSAAATISAAPSSDFPSFFSALDLAASELLRQLIYSLISALCSLIAANTGSIAAGALRFFGLVVIFPSSSFAPPVILAWRWARPEPGWR
jgi:hypothetical protein